MWIVAEAHAVFLTQEAESKPCRTWDEISESYDGELGRDETVMGMKLCRWWLGQAGKGGALSHSCATQGCPARVLTCMKRACVSGTGGRVRSVSGHRAELPLLPPQAAVIAHADGHQQVHAVARSQKWRDRQAAKAVPLPVSFFLSDAQQLAAAPEQQHAGGKLAVQQLSPQRRMQLQESAGQHAEEQQGERRCLFQRLCRASSPAGQGALQRVALTAWWTPSGCALTATPWACSGWVPDNPLHSVHQAVVLGAHAVAELSLWLPDTQVQ